MKIKLTGKQKHYLADSARDLWWQEMQKWDGQDVETWKDEMIKHPPSKPNTGQYAESGEPPSGWLAFFRSEGLVENQPQEWRDDELLASLVAYQNLQAAVLRGEKTNKKEAYRKLAAEFGRTDKAFEFRMQNISSVLNELGLPWISGLPPAKHVGSGVKSRLVKLIRENSLFESLLCESTGDALSDDLKVSELMTRNLGGPPAGKSQPSSIQVSRDEYARDLRVKDWVLQHANSQCEICGNDAPFTKSDGVPYLEVHHVRQLSQGGSDTTTNTVAICPNCHRELHFGSNSDSIIKDLYVRIERLIPE